MEYVGTERNEYFEGANVRSGSFASFWQNANLFWFTPERRHKGLNLFSPQWATCCRDKETQEPLPCPFD
jgi:hypothetical protein